MQRIFLKFRMWKIDSPLNFPSFSMNGGYSISFRYNAHRKWYVDNAGVNILDTILEGKYVDTGLVSLQDRKDKCFAVVEFDETVITAEDIAFDLTHDYSDYSIKVLTIDEAREFLLDFTTSSNGDGTFTLRDEMGMIGETTPAYTITL